MSHQKGRNAGVTGLVDISGTPAFTVRVAKFSRATATGAVVRTKRGDTFKRIRQSTPGSQLLLWGTVSQDGFPEPESLKGAAGTIELQCGRATKQTLAVVVTQATVSYALKGEDVWEIALVCEVTANPAYDGFGGTQTPAAADPALDAAETHEGATKHVDPDAIQDNDTRRYDVEGLADLDAAEATWVTNTIADAVATRAGMKVRGADFARTDHWGGVLTIQFARTTTGEDLVNEASSKTLDPQNLASQATTAALNATPPTPTGAAFKARGTSTREVNDGVTLQTTAWGLTDTRDDAQNPRITTTADPESIDDVAVRAQVWATSGAAPALPADAPANNVKLLGVTDLPLNDGERLRVWAYGAKSSRDELVLPQTETVDDANGLAGSAIRAYLDGEAAPAGPAGLVYRTTRTTPVTVGLGVNRTLYVDVYGVRTTAQDVLFPRTRAQADAAAIDQETLIPVLYAAGGSPVAPATPAGMVLYDSVDTPETDGRQCRVYRYRFVDRQTEAERAHTESSVDARALRSTARIAALYDSAGGAPGVPAAPADTKYVDYRDVPVPTHPTKVVRVWRFGPTDSVDDVTLPESFTFTDPKGLASRGAAALVNGSPAVPAGFKLRGTRARLLNTVNEDVQNVAEFGLTDTQDDIEFGGTRHTVDTAGLADADTVATVTNSASWQPPTNAGSLVLRDYERRQHVPGVFVFSSSYGPWTRDAELVARSSRTAAPAARGRVDADAVLASGTNPVSVALGGSNVASVDPTGSIENAAEAVRAALLGDPTFEGVDVERVHPSKLLLTLHRRGTRWWMDLESRTFSGLQTPWRLVSGGAVQVYVVDVVRVTSSLWAFVCGTQPVACTFIDFVIWKTYAGDTLYTNANAAGLTNADTFLGFGQLTVTYAGVTGPVAIKDTFRYPSATNPAAVAFEGARTQGWRFRFDSRGIVAGDGAVPGYWTYTTTDLSSVTPGTWVNASLLGIGAAAAASLNFTDAFLNTTP
jgi:hypothetical protein